MKRALAAGFVGLALVACVQKPTKPAPRQIVYYCDDGTGRTALRTADLNDDCVKWSETLPNGGILVTTATHRQFTAALAVGVNVRVIWQYLPGDLK